MRRSGTAWIWAWIWIAGFVGLVLAWPVRRAEAAELRFSLIEDATGTTIEVRGFEGEGEEPRVVTLSESGILLFFKDQTALAQRLTTHGEDRRLDYAQVGANGRRLAVRLTQRKGVDGKLAQFVSPVIRPNGVDIRIEDALKPGRREPPPATAQREPPADTIKALEASLGAHEPDSPLRMREPELELGRGGAAPGATAEPEPVETIRAAAPLSPTDRSTVAAARNEPDPGARVDDPTARATTASPRRGDDAVDADREDERSDDASFASSDHERGRDEPRALPEDRSTRSIWMLLSLTLALAVCAMAWWAKQRGTAQAGHAMEVVGRIALGPRQQLVWIKAADREFLIGSTEQRISLLTEINRPPTSVPQTTALAIPAAAAAPDPKLAAFKARLQAALGQELKAVGAGTPEPEPHPPELPDHLRRLMDDSGWSERGDAA